MKQRIYAIDISCPTCSAPPGQRCIPDRIRADEFGVGPDGRIGGGWTPGARYRAARIGGEAAVRAREMVPGHHERRAKAWRMDRDRRRANRRSVRRLRAQVHEVRQQVRQELSPAAVREAIARRSVMGVPLYGR